MATLLIGRLVVLHGAQSANGARGRPPPELRRHCLAQSAVVEADAPTESSKLIRPGATPQEGSMRRTRIISGVADFARSFAWYQTLLGLPKSIPAVERNPDTRHRIARFCAAAELR